MSDVDIATARAEAIETRRRQEHLTLSILIQNAIDSHGPSDVRLSEYIADQMELRGVVKRTRFK